MKHRRCPGPQPGLARWVHSTLPRYTPLAAGWRSGPRAPTRRDAVLTRKRSPISARRRISTAPLRPSRSRSPVDRVSDNTISRTLKKHAQAASPGSNGSSRQMPRGDWQFTTARCPHQAEAPIPRIMSELDGPSGGASAAVAYWFGTQGISACAAAVCCTPLLVNECPPSPSVCCTPLLVKECPPSPSVCWTPPR